MTTNKGKKVNKYRAHRWHGGGSKKKRRGKGSRGGKGMAGIWKHKKVWLRVHHPDYFSKRKKLKPRLHGKTLNLIDLEAMAQKGGKEFDLTEQGYVKLLGTGKVTTAVKVTIPSASKSAIEKIESAGGSVELS